MKKLLAMVLAIVVLLAPMALAAGQDVKIGNVVFSLNGESVDLSGMELLVGGGEQDGTYGGRIALLANDQSVAELDITLLGDTLVGTMDGISDAYSFSVGSILSLFEMFGSADIAEAADGFDYTMFAEVGEEVISAFMEGFSDDGVVTVNGESVYQYSLSIPSETMSTIICDALGVADEISAMVGLETDMKSSYAETGVALSLDGTIQMGNEFNASFALNAQSDGTEVEVLALNANVEYGEDGMTGSIVLGSGDVVFLSAEAVLGVVNGEFAYIESDFTSGDEAPVRFALYAPAAREDGAYEFIVDASDEDEETYLDIKVSDTEMSFELVAADMKIATEYTQTADDVGRVEAEIIEGADMVSIGWDVEILKDDMAWLAQDAGSAIDVLSIDEEQMEKVTGELTMKLLSSIGLLAGANDYLSDMISGLF